MAALQGGRGSHLKIVIAAKDPAEMLERGAGLVLRLHMTCLEGLDPHEPTLVVLDAHDTLWVRGAVLGVAVQDVGEVHDKWLGRCRLEAELSVPCHVLDCEEGACEC